VNDTIAWVVGRGGLLGGHVERSHTEFGEVFVPDRRFAWSTSALTSQLLAAVEQFVRVADGRRWRVAWCAGAGVVASDGSVFAAETAALATLLNGLGDALAAGRLGPGTMFFASSAGGLYAGARGAPFDEVSEVRPVSPYGETKQEQEALIAHWSARVGVPVLIGRIANLYGPGQDLTKPQGLISQLCWAQLRRQPTAIYVSLDTIRDYLYVADCASMVVDGLGVLEQGMTTGAPAAVAKVLASQRPTTIAFVLNEFRRIVKRAPRISLSASSLSRFQVRDLRLRSVVLPQLDAAATTPLPVGLHATIADLGHRLRTATA
jgi:UDP-glucose 4-epimerase